MADTTPTAAEGGKDALNAIFSGSTPAAAPEANAPPEGTETPSAANGADKSPVDLEGKPEWLPDKFWDPQSKGAKVEAMAKAYTHGWSELSRLQREEAARKASEQLPEKPDEYLTKMDWNKLQEAAPNAYSGGEGENISARSFLEAAHRRGVPPDKAHAMLVDYMAGINEHVMPPPKDEATLRKEAVQHLGPNGPEMFTQIQTWLASEAEKTPFTKDQMDFIQEGIQYGPALSFMWRVMRAQTSPGGPPTLNGTSLTQTIDTERAEVMRLLGNPEEYRKRKDEIDRRYAALPVRPGETAGGRRIGAQP